MGSVGNDKLKLWLKLSRPDIFSWLLLNALIHFDGVVKSPIYALYMDLFT